MKIVKVPPPGEYRVLHIVDGDTLDIGVPLADGTLLKQRIRLLELDTPERGQPGYKKATEDLRKLAGERVRISYASKGRRRAHYGRLLCYLWTSDGDESINEQMQKLGWGKSDNGAPKRRHPDTRGG
jgi:micrococcal nuclease